jgi:hypothetical protein
MIKMVSAATIELNVRTPYTIYKKCRAKVELRPIERAKDGDARTEQRGCLGARQYGRNLDAEPRVDHLWRKRSGGTSEKVKMEKKALRTQHKNERTTSSAKPP